jgi:hypothetical protein
MGSTLRASLVYHSHSRAARCRHLVLPYPPRSSEGNVHGWRWVCNTGFLCCSHLCNWESGVYAPWSYVDETVLEGAHWHCSHLPHCHLHGSGERYREECIPSRLFRCEQIFSRTSDWSYYSVLLSSSCWLGRDWIYAEEGGGITMTKG